MNFYYDYKSKFLKLLETISWLFIILSFFTKHHLNGINSALFISATILYLFLKLCSLKHWYKGHPNYAGIGLHFQRSMVGASYLMVLFAISNWFQMFWGFLLVDVLFIFLAHINIYLIYIFIKDKNKVNPQMYSNY